MLLSEPPPSQGDIHFRAFGFPVRVAPYFWLTTLLTGMGSRTAATPPGELLMWIGVVFVSILVHELGHAFTQRRFGGRPWIVLHGIGGLAICDDCDRRPRSQILISLAGPAAGFLLAGIVLAVVRLSGHAVGWAGPSEVPLGAFWLSIMKMKLYWSPLESSTANMLLYHILFVNIVWGLVNLLPVYPLDGGRVARELCTLGNPRRGIVLSLQISMATAGIVAVGGAMGGQLFVALMFGYLAYTNYQAMQSYERNSW